MARMSTGTGFRSLVTPRGRRDASQADREQGESARIPPERIAERAYRKFLARGGRHGNDLRDWFEAERELKAEIGRN